MIPLINKQTQIKFNYINKPINQIQYAISPSKQSRTSIQGFNSGIQSAIRPNQAQKYAFQVFQSLKLQTKNSLQSGKNLNSKKIISPQKKNYNNQYDLPEVYQSLHKGEQLEPVMQTQSINTSIPTLKAQHTNQQQKPTFLAQIPVMRESQFLSEGKKKNGKSVNYSNSKTVSSQQIVKNILQFNGTNPKNQFQNLNFIQNQNSFINRPSQSVISKKGTRQIKTFKYQNIPQQKQDQFNGCCGLGISNKMAFISRELHHKKDKNA